MNGSWTYTYDDFARLQSASGSQDFVYGYDQYANRWSTMTGTQQYSFNGVNNHITSNGFTYDAAGNVTNDSIHSYTYDAEGRLKGVDSGSTAKYNYDALGNRTMQFSTNPSVYNEYVVDLSGRAITAIQPGTSNVYTAEVFAGGRHWVTDNGSALFLGADWLGTTRALTNLSGTFDQLYTSLPWGDGLSSGGSSFHTTSQYTGKEYDPESGLYHFPARQYAPVQGRWLTPDPAGLSAMRLDSPQSWNRYAYVLNNPLSNTDPTGLYPGGDCDTADAGCTPNSSGGADGLGDDSFLAFITGYWPGDGGAFVVTGINFWNFGGQGNGQNGPATCGVSPLAPCGGANTGQTPKPTSADCLGQALSEKGFSIVLDFAGAIPGVGNLISGTAATIETIDGVVLMGHGLVTTGTALLESDPSGGVSGGTELVLGATNAVMGGTKAIPIAGNVVAGVTGLYDSYQAYKTYQQCMAGGG